MKLTFNKVVESIPSLVPFLAPEAIERELGRPFRIRLGANESSFGISPLASAAIEAAISRVGWYGDPEAFDLKEALAAQFSISSENLSVGAGADDLLGLVARTFIEPGVAVVNSLGGYPTFNYVAQAQGGVLHTVPYKNDRVDLQGLVEMAHDVSAKLVFVANPDNPSGSWHDSRALSQAASSLPEGCLLILDEAYSDFAPGSSTPPCAPETQTLIRVRTFSKAHGMAGARIGFAIAAREIIASFNKIRLHFAVNRLAQAGALASLHDPEFVATVVKEVETGRAEYAQLAKELGLKSLTSTTNFVLIDMGSFEASQAMVRALAKDGVFVRMPGAAPLNRCIRVTVGTRAERELFSESFRRLVPTVVENPS